MFSPQNGEKTKWGWIFLDRQKCPCVCAQLLQVAFIFVHKKKKLPLFFLSSPLGSNVALFFLGNIASFSFSFFHFSFFFLLTFAWVSLFFFFSWQHCPFFLGSNVASYFFLFSFSILFFFFFLFSRAWRDSFFFFFFFLTRHGFWKYIYKFGWLLFFCGYLSFFLF